MNTDDAYNKIVIIITGIFYETFEDRMEAIEAIASEWKNHDFPSDLSERKIGWFKKLDPRTFGECNNMSCEVCIHSPVPFLSGCSIDCLNRKRLKQS